MMGWPEKTFLAERAASAKALRWESVWGQETVTQDEGLESEAGAVGRGQITLAMVRTPGFLLSTVGSHWRILSIAVTPSNLHNLGTRMTDPQQVGSKEIWRH